MSKKKRKLLERLLEDNSNSQLDPSQLQDLAGMPDEAIKRAATKLGNRNFNDVVEQAGGRGGIPGLLAGEEGMPGLPGKGGSPGMPGKEGIAGLPGEEGIPGKEGIPGTPGKEEVPGLAGKGAPLDNETLEKLVEKGKVAADAMPEDAKAKLKAEGRSGNKSARAAVERTQQPQLDKQKVAQALFAAVGKSLEMWRLLARVDGVNVSGPIATHGRLTGPGVASWISMLGPNASPAELRITSAFAGEVERGFTHWQSKFHIPALPIFPSFAAVPGAQAPPTLGNPFPLAAALPHPLHVSRNSGISPAADEVFKLVAELVESWFAIWLTSRKVPLIGRGPVPTFAPPFIPVGPVLGGSASMAHGTMI